MSWIRRTLFRFPKTLLVVVLATAFYQIGWHTPKLPLPLDVRRTNVHLTLTGEEVGASVYAPRDLDAPAPVVVVAHGFSRSRRYMAGWGMALAQNGMIAVVLNQPAFADWRQNGRALAELAKQLRTEGDALTGLKTNGDVALVGFSMGGLSTLLAAETDPKVRCWVGLDPVDFKGRGVRAIQKLDMPCCILRAEPGAWNRGGNARQLVEAAKTTLFALKVKDATHCDVEEPTDLAGKLACGWTDPSRHDVFVEYAVAFLRGILLADDAAKAALDHAKNDERVKEVVSPSPPPGRRASG